ncbi:hypothetical protein HPP92_019282 [Vanilla planifolia]|uniref:Uncharacterized protein n=1 Tax=Vanilla planifolia TaxID=51239 RepID=A0A835QEM2_VANPL|nr:hypothetical protein HPP92_019282 [Vanilla planifolia]
MNPGPNHADDSNLERFTITRMFSNATRLSKDESADVKSLHHDMRDERHIRAIGWLVESRDLDDADRIAFKRQSKVRGTVPNPKFVVVLGKKQQGCHQSWKKDLFSGRRDV